MLHEVLPGVYLASYVGARESKHTHCYVINCTRDLPMIHDDGERLAVDDDLSKLSIEVMTDALPLLVKTIDEKVASGKDVVVHCMAGQQRSAAVVAAYVMSKMGLGVDDAIAFVRSKKRDAFFWQANFRQSLVDYHGNINASPP